MFILCGREKEVNEFIKLRDEVRFICAYVLFSRCTFILDKYKMKQLISIEVTIIPP